MTLASRSGFAAGARAVVLDCSIPTNDAYGYTKISDYTILEPS